tara:strand:- start:6449 stop:6682 length:234 start_codon:yes stop_codon:yes gene_type:complete
MSHLTPILTKKVEALEEIQKCENRIKELKDKIDELDKHLYKECNHNWIRDNSCSDDDLGKNYCEHCGLRYYYKYKTF